MNTDKYTTIKDISEGIYKEKGSKFISFAYPITQESEVKEIIKNLKKTYYDARHVVYAYLLGVNMDTFRYSDDGEPPNSSGPHVFGQIKALNLTNILIVVIRYFGGTKLGIPGLINAYKNAAKNALDNNTIIEKYEYSTFTLKFSYPEINKVMKILKDNNIEQKNQQFDNICKITISLRKSETDKIKHLLLNINNLTIK